MLYLFCNLPPISLINVRKFFGLSFERPYLIEGLNLMIAKCVKSADFVDFMVFADFGAVFGSFGNEPIQSCSVRRVLLALSSLSALVSASSASVYSPPSDSFNHRNFLSCKYMQLYP